MEADKLQEAWKELNDRIIKNELIHRQGVIKMLTSQKESCLEKVMRLEKVGLIVVAGLNLMLLYVYIVSTVSKPSMFWITAFFATISALIMQSMELRCIRNISVETNLEKQVRHILKFKLLYNRVILMSYLIIVPFLFTFLYLFGTFLNYLLIGGLLFILCILDYFIFHFVHDKIGDMMQVNKELKELCKTENDDL